MRLRLIAPQFGPMYVMAVLTCGHHPHNKVENIVSETELVKTEESRQAGAEPHTHTHTERERQTDREREEGRRE